MRLRGTEIGRQRYRRGADRLVPRAPRRLQMPALHRVRGNPEDQHREDSEIQAPRHGEGNVSREHLLAPRRKRHATLPAFHGATEGLSCLACNRRKSERLDGGSRASVATEAVLARNSLSGSRANDQWTSASCLRRAISSLTYNLRRFNSAIFRPSVDGCESASLISCSSAR